MNATAALVGVSKEAVGRLLRESGPVSYQLFGYPKAWSTPRLSSIGTERVEIRPRFGKGRLAQVVACLGWTKANTSAIFNRATRELKNIFLTKAVLKKKPRAGKIGHGVFSGLSDFKIAHDRIATTT